MRAIRVHRFGGPEVLTLEDVEIPTPAAGQALIRIAACGVGPWDAWIRAGHSVLPQPLPLTPGSDIAGTVEAVGVGVQDIAPGDSVFGATNKRFTGGYAEYAVAEAGMLAGAPPRLTPQEAASVPVVAVTAWQMLFEHARLKAGQRVLILGANGNVGRYAVQLAQRADLAVTTVTRGDNEEAVLQGLAGAMDAVIDAVGGETQRNSVATLKVGGIIVSAVSAPDREELTRRQVRGHFMLVEVTAARLRDIATLLQQRELTPSVGEVLPLQSARIAHEKLDGLRPAVPGKLILQP